MRLIVCSLWPPVERLHGGIAAALRFAPVSEIIPKHEVYLAAFAALHFNHFLERC
jgi:hypothetical protein